MSYCYNDDDDDDDDDNDDDNGDDDESLISIDSQNIKQLSTIILSK